jgi:uncharacterized protein YndB with AHSA1/START domain
MNTTYEPPIRELIIERVLDAPRELVFQTWTDPKHLAHWWGPKGFTNPVCELDLRSGGAIRIHMQGPDGVIYPMRGTVHEFTPPERLVFTSTAFEEEEGNPKLEVLNTVTFGEQDGKTRLRVEAVIVKASPEVDPALAGMEPGWNQSLDKLAEYVSAS